MNKPPLRKLPFHSTAPVNHVTGQVEWEELPSLAGELHKRLIVRGSPKDFAESSSFHSTWDDATMPASLEPVYEPEPFRESSITGLATREVRDTDVFRHFFA